MNGVVELLKQRVSLRRYEQKPVSQEHLDTILECAIRAPTAGNMMLYSIIMVEDKGKKESLSRSCDNQPFIARAPLVLVFAADYQKWYDYYHAGNVAEYCRREGLPFVYPTEANLLLAACDALVAAQNAVVAGESLGIGSCYIGDIMERYEDHRKLLNLPDYVFPVAMLCMGYYPGKNTKKYRSRFRKEYVVFKDSYRRLNEGEIEDMFGSLEGNFRAADSSDRAQNYAQRHYAKKTGAPFSQEMTRSVGEALKIWNGQE
ncbi:MAG: nitroreductase [Firmicutes bacterium]|nr:nitroreductase [Bacillota bacterium]